MADARAQAKELVTQFANRPGEPYIWKHIRRTEVASGLRERIDDPARIDQAGSSLCGAAALMYDLARDDPVKYVRYVIDLFEQGHALLGTLDIKPGTDLKHYQPQSINRADWVALASLRDSTNWFLDYESEKDEAAGVTLPSTLAGWFRRTGYSSIINETNLFFCKGIENAKRASRLLQEGYKVSLFINSDMLDREEQDQSGRIVKIITTHNNKSWVPDHWVVLRSPITTDPTVSFEIYTWGNEHMRIPRTEELTVKHFLNNYYGFVACKY